MNKYVNSETTTTKVIKNLDESVAFFSFFYVFYTS